jgi:quercetin dioxygenase-like cupin family protein
MDAVWHEVAEKRFKVIDVDSVESTKAPFGTLKILFDREKGVVKDANIHIHITEFAPGVSHRHKPHTHDHDEIILILEGKAREGEGPDSVEAGPGQVLYIPAGVEHGTGNIGDGILKLMVILPSTPSKPVKSMSR